MSTAVPCPKCGRLVTLPVAGEGRWWVRCPLCRREYLLQEAMSYSPPVLEFVHRGGAPAPTAIDDAPVPKSSDAGISQPAAIDSLPDFLIASGAELETRPAPPPPHPAEEFTLQPAVNIVAGAPVHTAIQSMPLVAPGIVAGPIAKLAEPANPIAADVDDAWMSTSPGTASSPGVRRRKKKSNPQMFFLQIVGGGIVGLALAVGILFWGFKVDLLNLAKQLPSFMVPDQLKNNDESQPSSQ